MNMKKFGLFEMGSGNSKPLETWDADDIVTGRDPYTVIVLRDTDTVAILHLKPGFQVKVF